MFKYIKKGSTYYAQTPEQYEAKRRYEYQIEAVYWSPNFTKLRGYEVYNYEGTKRLTTPSGCVYFSTLKEAKAAAWEAYNSRIFEEKFNSIGQEA